MKKKRLNITISIICLFAMILTNSGCMFLHRPRYEHPDLVGVDSRGGEIYFFQFRDSTLMDKIIVTNAELWESETDKSKYVKQVGDKYVIPIYPRNSEGQPLFGEQASGTWSDLGYMNGDFYTLDDLVSGPKFIPLKGGYYICYPFTTLELAGRYIDAEWKDFYNIDFNQVETITLSPYRKRYVIHEKTLANLTKKSTAHFKRENTEVITIDDVVEILNTLIETNRIEEYCYVAYN